MSIKDEREDIGIAVKNLVTAIIQPLSVYERLAALQWMISILEEMQDNAE